MRKSVNGKPIASKAMTLGSNPSLRAMLPWSSGSRSSLTQEGHGFESRRECSGNEATGSKLGANELSVNRKQVRILPFPQFDRLAVKVHALV